MAARVMERVLGRDVGECPSTPSLFLFGLQSEPVRLTD